METTSAIRTILGQKGREVWTVTPEATVFQAIQQMAEKNVGALVVLREGTLAGIVSERDYTRKVILRGRSSKETLVREIMSGDLITAKPSDTIDSCMRVMTERRVRHLPVVEDGQLVGVISIGDLLRWVILAQTATIDQLHKYIAGDYPG